MVFDRFKNHEVHVRGDSCPQTACGRGRLGFLTDIMPEEMLGAVDAALEGRLVPDERPLLRALLRAADGQVAEARHNPLPPACIIGIERLCLEPAKRQRHDRLAVGGQGHRGSSRVNSGHGELMQVRDPALCLGHSAAYL